MGTASSVALGPRLDRGRDREEREAVIRPRLIVVDRKHFSMDLYQWSVRSSMYVHKNRYTITVGKQGSATPHGLYVVTDKTRHPDWRVPPGPDYPDWLWNDVIPFGADGNPFKSGFISLGGHVSGVGIHDTTFEPHVGTASSHGCVRMLTDDFLEIYKWCKEGTPVYLH